MGQVEMPDWLDAEASPAFVRITDHLWRKGEWRPQYVHMAAIAAMACSIYTRLLRHRDSTAADIEEVRQSARLALAAMAWFPEARARIGPIDADGHDKDLVDICKPLERKEMNS